MQFSIYNSPFVKELRAFAAPFTTALKETVQKIGTLLDQFRVASGELLINAKYELIIGTSVALSFFWLYLFIFMPPDEPVAKKRNQIPLSKNDN